MKSLVYALICFAAGVGAYFFGQTEQGAAFKAAAQDCAYELMYDRELHFRGTGILSAEQLREFLPEQKSNLWWHFHESKMRATLMQHPLVKDVAISRCDSFSWKCFVFELEELHVTAFALFGDEAWFVGPKGAVVGSAKSSTLLKSVGRQIEGEGVVPPVIKGLDKIASSPDAARAALHFILKAIDTLQSETELKVSEVKLLGQGELSIVFKQHDFRVRIDSADESGRVLEQAQRLRRLMEELGGKLHLVSELDLAYGRLAVVKLKDSKANKSKSKK